MAQFRLKDSVYALEDSASGLHYELKGTKARLKRLPLATMAPATPYCRGELILAGAEANVSGELVRVDA